MVSCQNGRETVIQRCEGGCVDGTCVQGCIDLDSDGCGEGPECLCADCDEADPERSFRADERCNNGKDDDCLVDGEDVENCTCREGDARTCGATDTGDCEYGESRCMGGTWSDCDGEVGPSPEECDGRDNDCDGTADEDGVCQQWAYLHGDLWPMWYNMRVACDPEHRAWWRCKRIHGPRAALCASLGDLYEACITTWDEGRCMAGVYAPTNVLDRLESVWEPVREEILTFARSLEAITRLE